jgi:hypothetical protein
MQEAQNPVRGVRPSWLDESSIDRDSVAKANVGGQLPARAKRVGGGGPKGLAQVDGSDP